jgi:hypothetical protein
MKKAKRRTRKRRPQRNFNPKQTNNVITVEKAREPQSSTRQKPSQGKFLQSSRKLMIWFVGTIIAIAIPSYVLLRADSPTQDNVSLAQVLMQQESGNFSFGFSSADISKFITLQSDDAMSIRWIRQSDGLMALFSLGPYTVQNMTTKIQMIAMVPASADLVQCGYTDVDAAMSRQGTGVIPIVSSQCAMYNTPIAKYYSIALAPKREPNRVYFIAFGFIWHKPIITHLGAGKEAIDLRYQGRFSLNPAAHFVPADRVKVRYDIANSADPTGLPVGVYLEYESSLSETVTAAPPPSTTNGNAQIWIANADRPTYDISVITEDSKTSEIFQLGEQGIFLVIGGIIGATFPRLRRKGGGDDK